MQTKDCYQCKQNLPISEFYPVNNGKYHYLSSLCKPCSKKGATERNRKRLIKKVQEMGGGVTCPVCGQLAFEISNRHARMHGYKTATELVKARGGVVSGEHKSNASKEACLTQWSDGFHNNNSEAARISSTERWTGPLIRQQRAAWLASVAGIKWRNGRSDAGYKSRNGYLNGRTNYVNKDGKILILRSKAELFFSVFLDALDIPYIYEGTPLRVTDTTKYLPDFTVGYSVIEVKGAIFRDNLAKAATSCLLNGLNLCVFDIAKVREYKNYYSFLYRIYRSNPSSISSYKSFIEEPTHGYCFKNNGCWSPFMLRHLERVRSRLLCDCTGTELAQLLGRS